METLTLTPSQTLIPTLTLTLTFLGLIVEASASFTFPDAGTSPDGLEPKNKVGALFKPKQDRYGHCVEASTPEKEKQRKGRFSAQSSGRSKRSKK